MNNIFTVVLGPVVGIMLIVLMVFYWKAYERWGEPDFDEKYGAFFDGLRRDTKWALFYHLIFLFRRLAFSIVAIFALEYFFVKVWCLFIFSTL